MMYSATNVNGTGANRIRNPDFVEEVVKSDPIVPQNPIRPNFVTQEIDAARILGAICARTTTSSLLTHDRYDSEITLHKCTWCVTLLTYQAKAKASDNKDL